MIALERIKMHNPYAEAIETKSKNPDAICYYSTLLPIVWIP